MPVLAAFGIENDGLNLAVNLLLLFLVVIWFALVYWTYADARRRMTDPMLIGCSAAASLFPFVGTIVYMIVRPPEYLEDARERELEIAAAEARLASVDHHACPYCDFEVERSFLRCPSCLRRLKEPCVTCGKPLDPRWKICPYCEAEIGRPATAAARPRARRTMPREPVEPVAERREPREPREPATRESSIERREPRPLASTARAREQAPPASTRQSRPARPPREPRAADGNSEQPATRPRTRPPSAG
jgi:hypothetical protein